MSQLFELKTDFCRNQAARGTEEERRADLLLLLGIALVGLAADQVYQTLGMGKVVGMPVPGTMTSVNWVTMQNPLLFFGIPAVGYRTEQGDFLENKQLEPDVVVPLDYNRVLEGHDSQLEAAVRVLLEEVKAHPQPTFPKR